MPILILFFENNSTISNSNWEGVYPSDGKASDLDRIKLNSPLPSDVYETTHSAQDAFQKILQTAGASLVRDKIDERILKEVKDIRQTQKARQ